jgi:hypothetical protein
MKRQLIQFIILSAILSCEVGEQPKTYTFENLITFDIPAKTEVKDGKGIDSRVAKIEADGKVLATIEYGEFAFRLKDKPAVVFPDSIKEGMLKRLNYPAAEDAPLFSSTPEEDQEEGVFLKNYYWYDTINGIVIKRVRPKITSRGITGALINQVKGKNTFIIYGSDLDSSEQAKLETIITSMRFKSADQ